MEIKIANPVEFDGQLISSLSIRPPTHDDLAAARRLNVGRYMRGLRFLERLTGHPTRLISEIMKSNAAVADQVEKFVLSQLS